MMLPSYPSRGARLTQRAPSLSALRFSASADTIPIANDGAVRVALPPLYSLHEGNEPLLEQRGVFGEHLLERPSSCRRAARYATAIFINAARTAFWTEPHHCPPSVARTTPSVPLRCRSIASASARFRSLAHIVPRV